MTMNVEKNVQARKVANDLVELGITMCKEAGLDAQQTRRAWFCVREIIDELLGEDREETPTPAPTKKTKKKEKQRSIYEDDIVPCDDDPFPFGKHKGEPYGDLPDDYYQWLSTWEGIEGWPQIQAYIEDKGLA